MAGRESGNRDCRFVSNCALQVSSGEELKVFPGNLPHRGQNERLLHRGQ